jgi:flagellar biosynthesis/type III secretory pathway M-ring protein FliF/YscJ
MAALLARWNALSARHRLLAVGLVVAGALAAVLAFALQRDARVALFATPLRPEQVTEVVERLAEWNVAFVAESENVRVDPGRKREVLLRLSLAGVPHVHHESLHEMLATAGALTPQSVLDAQAREGLAGDIASGLRGVAGVEDAQVIVAPAKPAAFADEPSRDASASVRLTLRPGAVLSKDAADGVRAYVAASVPGLDPARVALLDDRGALASDGGSIGSGGGEPGEGELLQRSLQSALDDAFGAGTTIARVRVAYDPRSRETHETDRRPVGSRAITSNRDDERYSTREKRYAKIVSSDEHGSMITDERIAVAPDRLERLSVAIAVDASRNLDVLKIRSLAWGIVGLVQSRGDTLRVEAVSFAHPIAQRGGDLTMLALVGLAGSVLPGALAVLAIGIGVRYGAKPVVTAVERLGARAVVRARTREVASYPPAHVRGVLRGEPPHTAAAIISALPAATATAVLELYPPDERAAIVRRMARAAAPVVPDYESVIRRG